MASITWTCVFALLIVELVVTLILVVPVPRRFRNFVARKCIFRFHLGERFSKIVGFVAAALIFALVESYVSVNRLMEKLQIMAEQDMVIGAVAHGHHHGHDKEKLYRAERNMYLAGFALTLLLVVGRILQLMQESVELEDQLEFATKSRRTGADANATTEGVEMTEISKPKQPQEKKKD